MKGNREKVKFWFVLLLAAGPITVCQSQEKITLADCYALAARKSAIAGEAVKYSEIWKLRDASLASSWFPSLDASANAVYNSEVIDLGSNFSSIPIPGLASAIKPMPHEQYRITVDISQTIYDGGAVKNSRKAELADLEVNRQQSEVDLYSLNSQVNSAFFSVLSAQKQKELLSIFLNLLRERMKSVESGVKNGVVQATDIDALNSEILKTEQQIEEISLKSAALLQVLGSLTGKNGLTADDLIIPSLEEPTDSLLLRPELELFDLRINQLNTAAQLLDSRRKPRAFGFATLGYGNPPGNNFLRDEFAPYYVIGAGIKWNIYDWSRTRNDKQAIKIKTDILSGRKNETEETIRRQMELKESEIKSLRAIIRRDSEIIELRKRISSSTLSKYENGVVTASELLSDLNAEKQALINLELHKTGLELALAEYMNITGNKLK
jgi:outer membrane protein TolC